MQSTKEAKNAKFESGDKQASHEFTPELQKSLIEQAKTASEEHRRIEMARLKEDTDTRHALLTTLEPKEREHVAQALKARSAATVVQAPSTLALRPFPPQLAYPVPIYAIDYQIMRPPFVPDGFQPASRHTQACYNIPNDTLSDLLLESRECVPELGALSLECAIGVVNHNSCGSGQTGLFGWWENSASAFMTFLKIPRVRVPSLTQLLVEVDYAIEGPAQWWALFMIPGEPGNQLGLVGGLGMANMSVSAYIQNGQQVQKTYERFLLGSASAHFPGGAVDLTQTFTLRTSLAIPSGEVLYWYQIYMDAHVSVFRSDGAPGLYPGYAQVNLTLPGSGGAIGPSAPLKVKEIRTALISI
jgi:hypothetical protein